MDNLRRLENYLEGSENISKYYHTRSQNITRHTLQIIDLPPWQK